MRNVILFLLFVVPFVSAHYVVQTTNGIVVSTYPDSPPRTGLNETIHIALSHTDSRPIQLDQLDIVHEREMHVFIVGSDMDTFTHTHPDDYPNGFVDEKAGIYNVNMNFSKAGWYLVAADYTVGGVNTIAAVPVQVIGPDLMSQPVVDNLTTKQIGEYTVSLEKPTLIAAGNDTAFTYHLEKNGGPIHDLQMYLGSEVHVFVVRNDLTNEGHTHSYIPAHTLHYGNMSQYYVGPNVPMHYTFSEPGDYTIFSQFEENNTVITAHFSVSVAPPNNQTFTQYENSKRNAAFFAQWSELLIVVIGLGVGVPFLLWIDKRKKR